MSIPFDIESYLTPDEKIVKIGKSRKWKIYITDKRVIFRKGGMFGKEIVEASYRHISSIEHKKKSPWGYIIVGLFFIVFGLFLVIYYLPRIYTQVSTFFYSYRTVNLINLILAGLGFIEVILGDNSNSL